MDKASWRPVLLCEHHQQTVESEDVIVYREVEEQRKNEDASPSQSSSIYTVCRCPDDFPNSKCVPLDRPDPKLGVGMQCWSPSGTYLATRNDNLSWVVWIWNMDQRRLTSVMIQRQSIKFIKWEPDCDVLAVGCGNPRIFLWSPDGASVVHIPFRKFQSMKIVWNERTPTLVLADSQTFCIGYLLDSQS